MPGITRKTRGGTGRREATIPRVPVNHGDVPVNHGRTVRPSAGRGGADPAGGVRGGRRPGEGVTSPAPRPAFRRAARRTRCRRRPDRRCHREPRPRRRCRGPAVDRLLLRAVGTGEGHVVLLPDALGVTDVDRRHHRPLLQAGAGAGRHGFRPGLVLHEAVDRHAVPVDDDLPELRVPAGGQAGPLGRLRLLALGVQRVPLAAHALALGVAGVDVLGVAVGRPAADGGLLGAVGPDDLAEQRLVDAPARRGVVGGHRRPGLGAVAVAVGLGRLRDVLVEAVQGQAEAVGHHLAEFGVGGDGQFARRARGGREAGAPPPSPAPAPVPVWFPAPAVAPAFWLFAGGGVS